MMYATENEFARDFAARTLANYRMLEDESFEVTALINSTVGLLMISYQKLYGKINDSFVSANTLERVKNSVKENSFPDQLSLSQILLHMKNAVFAGQIVFAAEKPNLKNSPLKIMAVTFTDKNDNHEIFVLELQVDLLNDFFIEFARHISYPVDVGV